MKKMTTQLSRGVVLTGLLTMAMGLLPMKSNAQLSSNADKFLGNITSFLPD